MKSNHRPAVTETPAESRRHVGQLLNLLLADETVLYLTTRDYHWNVSGPGFRSFHQQFEEQYEQLAQWIDDLAERARALRVGVRGNGIELTNHARVSAKPGAGLPTAQMLACLLKLHDAVIAQLRGDRERCDELFNDPGTADLLTGLMVSHEKIAWMLRSELAT